MKIEKGQVFGKLIVIEKQDHPKSKQWVKWVLECECGNRITRRASDIRLRKYSECCSDCRKKLAPLSDDERKLVSDYYARAMKAVLHVMKRRKYTEEEDTVRSAAGMGLIRALRKHPETFQEKWIKLVENQVVMDTRAVFKQRKIVRDYLFYLSNISGIESDGNRELDRDGHDNVW